MKRKLFIAQICFTWMFAFTLYDDLIPMTFDGQVLDKPFLGGFNCPRIQWLDWDMDGDTDLFLLDADGYIRYIENQGSASLPDFHLVTTSFYEIFCGDCIQGWFYFADFDADGDLDLTTQNEDDRDHVSYFRNSWGELTFIEALSDLNGGYVTSSSVMTPTFADIDNNGSMDFFTGNSVGTLTYYNNTGLYNGLPRLEFITNTWEDIYIVGPTNLDGEDDRHGASAITFIDLDDDGDLDLSWGDYFQQSLYIIWNSGTPEIAEMNEVTSQYPPEDPVFTYGRNMPTFADLDGDGDEDLYVTVLSGAYGNQLIDNFIYYENSGSNSDPTYELITNNYFSTLDIYSNSSPELADIDSDGDLDLFIANHEVPDGSLKGRIYFFRNTGTSSNPIYEEEIISILDEGVQSVNMKGLSPELGDMDGDGDLDLLVGNSNGIVLYFKNISSGSNLIFDFIEILENVGYSSDSVPTLGDLDADGDLDLLLGLLNGSLMFYRNIGDTSQFNFQETVFDDIQLEKNAAPELMDIDGDGDLDLALGSANEGIMFYRNLGSSSNYSFQLDVAMEHSTIGVNTKPAIGHLFNGETLDIIIGLSSGGVYHLQTELCNALLGDLNGDFFWNVLDVVTLANCILAQICENTEELENGCAGDMNGDGGWNVLDIVQLANCVISASCGS